MGVAAFVLAVVFALIPYLSTVLFIVAPLASTDMMSVAMVSLLVHEAGIIVALVLGIIATVTRRGRGWAIAAIVISVLLNQMLSGALIQFVYLALMPQP